MTKHMNTKSNKKINQTKQRRLSLKAVAIYTFVTIAIGILLTLATQEAFSQVGGDDDAFAGISEITNDVVISRIDEQYFAVTRTIYSDQEVTITFKRAPGLDEFFRNREVIAEARVRTDIGVDLSALTSEQIIIDRENKTISISGTETSILDSSIFGDLTIRVEGSIFTEIFDNTNNDDYQLASRELIAASTRAIESDEELRAEARAAITELLNLLFAELGYTVVLV